MILAQCCGLETSSRPFYKFGWLISCGLKDIHKMHPLSCTNTHHDVTNLVKYWMVKNTKT